MDGALHLPNKNLQYKDQEYWEERYKQESDVSYTFDWFKTWKDLKNVLLDKVSLSGDLTNILMLGSGNSTLSEEMYQDGFVNIVNVDYSVTVITNMRKRMEHILPGSQQTLQWLVMDIRHLDFGDSSFNVAIDKGTLDALIVDEKDPWHPSESAVKDVERYISEVKRVLQPGGTFIYITFGQPHFRTRFLADDACWSLQVVEFGESFHYYCYILKKKLKSYS